MTEDDVRDLIETLREAQHQWVNGEVNSIYDLTEGTVFGPFGGPTGGGPGARDGQSALAARFHDGTSDLEVVQTIVAGDVACVVAIEWNTVRFDDDSEARPWILRTTNVLRRDAEGWTLLHRHADPLIDRRDPAATFALLPPRERP